MQEKFILEDRQEKLAHSLIEEFLKREGYSFHTLNTLSPERLKQLMTRASLYVSTHLAEIDDRAQLVTGLHHATDSHPERS